MLNLNELRKRVIAFHRIYLSRSECLQMLDIIEVAKLGMDESRKHDDSELAADYYKLAEYRRKLSELLEDVELGDGD